MIKLLPNQEQYWGPGGAYIDDGDLEAVFTKDDMAHAVEDMREKCEAIVREAVEQSRGSRCYPHIAAAFNLITSLSRGEA